MISIFYANRGLFSTECSVNFSVQFSCIVIKVYFSCGILKALFVLSNHWFDLFPFLSLLFMFSVWAEQKVLLIFYFSFNINLGLCIPRVNYSLCLHAAELGVLVNVIISVKVIFSILLLAAVFKVSKLFSCRLQIADAHYFGKTQTCWDLNFFFWDFILPSELQEIILFMATLMLDLFLFFGKQGV